MIPDVERRDFMRLSAETEASVTRLTSGEALSVKLSDLSASGCSFVTATAIEPGEELEILVRGASERIEPLRRAGRVARVTQCESDYLVGVEFLTEAG